MQTGTSSRRIRSYKDITKILRQRILAGEIKNGSRMDSMRAIAKQEGASVTTVSKALDQLEKEGLLRKVARSGIFVQGDSDQAERKSKLIGLISPSMPHAAFTETIGQVIQPSLQGKIMKQQNRFSVHCCKYHPNNQYLWDYVPAEEFGRCGLDGIITLGLFSSNYFAELVKLNIPICAFDVDVSDLGIDSVFFDNIKGAFELTRHLIEAGHKEILFIGGSLPGLHGDRTHQYDPCSVERATGYRLAMQALAPDLPCRMYHCRDSRTNEDTMQAIDRALEDAPGTTAAVADVTTNHPEFERRNIVRAGFGAKPRSGGPQGRTSTAALCDFAAMEDLALETLNKRMANPFRPVERLLLELEIHTMKGKQPWSNSD